MDRDEDDSLSLHLSDEEIDVLSVDQREGEEDFDKKLSPRLQGLISRAAAALRVTKDLPHRVMMTRLGFSTSAAVPGAPPLRF